MHSKMSFCVVGSGIMGLSSAYCLAKRFRGCKIVVLAEKLPPYTTSNDSFGICGLRNLDERDGEHTVKWTKITGAYLKETLQNYPDSKEMGITDQKVYITCHKEILQNDNNSRPRFDTFSYHRKLSIDEMRSLGYDERRLGEVFGKEHVEIEDLLVYKAGSWVIDTASYLPWLIKEIQLMEARGEIFKFQFIEKKISDFSQTLTYGCNCVVNCAGLGAEYLVPDAKMVPIRGQYLIAERKREVEFRYGGHTFICPKPGRVGLGSVYQVGRRDTEVDPKDTADILRRCSVLNPDVVNWKIIKEDVGIRPGRLGGPRVDLEWRQISASNVPIIHNYGHGSKGIMQHWGCAQEVVKLAERALTMQSKL